jgi:hypothetical protein
MTDAAAVGVRYERMDDEGLFGGIDQVLQETTITTEYRLAEGFLARRVPARLVERAILSRTAGRHRSAARTEHGARRRGVVVRQHAGRLVGGVRCCSWE